MIAFRIARKKQKRWGLFFRVLCNPIEGNVVTSSYNSLKDLLNGYLESFNNDIEYKPRHPMEGEAKLTPETWIDIDAVKVHSIWGEIFYLEIFMIQMFQLFLLINKLMNWRLFIIKI